MNTALIRLTRGVCELCRKRSTLPEAKPTEDHVHELREAKSISREPAEASAKHPGRPCREAVVAMGEVTLEDWPVMGPRTTRWLLDL